MKSKLWRRRLACMIAITCWATSARSFAQDVESKPLSVSPAAVADSPVSQSLLPTLREQIPGNAVVWYGQVYAEQQALMQQSELWSKMGEMIELPANDMAKSHPQFAWLGSQPIDSGVFGSLRKAARSRQCDWQLLYAGEPFFEILLPEVQRSRSYARLIVLRVKFQIAEQRFGDALESLQLGFALAKHVAQGDTLVCTLVALGIEDMMADCLFDWVQQPGAPNLAWALAELPDPLVDLRPGLDAERIGLESTYPLFAQARRIAHHQFGSDSAASSREYLQNWGVVAWSSDQWTDGLRDFWDRSDLFGGQHNRSRPALGLLVLEAYPKAKAALVRTGYPASQVEAFSVAQTIAVQSYDAQQRRIQDLIRWAYQPTAVALAGLEKQRMRDVAAAPVLPIDDMLGNSIQEVVRRQAKVQRKVAVLRMIEAVRNHAASHGGNPPASIDAIEALPIPSDPATGTPFQYDSDGSTTRIATRRDPSPQLTFQPIELVIQTEGDQ
ncbi:hypothetical protein Mal15_10990 [Stieleria maiorica]|uniref:Secreted protein n=1 Tax=Stieleria maiorica TaxID=2795974 RepID=A0A5B9MBU2_9BACT|nr:hypothetical protein [Stieleria maiorica]QEF97064.1 hypothetical protein Mal15_10990 [Stieleria maiorica]